MYIDKFKNKGYIFLENPKTWPTDWISLIEKNRELIINYLAEGHAIINEQEELKKSGHEDEIDYFKQNKYNIEFTEFTKSFNALILSTNQQILCYHATRLMDYEVELIKQNGLRKCTQELRKEKIDNLLSNNIIDNQTYESLNKENILNVKGEARLNLTYVLWGYNILDISDDGQYANFLNYYGGEVVYKLCPDHIEKKLQQLSKPYVVLCNKELNILLDKSNNNLDLSFYLIRVYFYDDPEKKFFSFALRDMDSLPVFEIIQHDLWNR